METNDNERGLALQVAGGLMDLNESERKLALQVVGGVMGLLYEPNGPEIIRVVLQAVYAADQAAGRMDSADSFARAV